MFTSKRLGVCCKKWVWFALTFAWEDFSWLGGRRKIPEDRGKSPIYRAVWAVYVISPAYKHYSRF